MENEYLTLQEQHILLLHKYKSLLLETKISHHQINIDNMTCIKDKMHYIKDNEILININHN